MNDLHGNKTIIQNGWIQFSNDSSLEEYDDIQVILNNKDEISKKYGILSFNTITTEITDESLVFHFMVDVSGSMSDRMRDGRSKMLLIIHTLTNMFHYFAENTKNVYIEVTGFDDHIHVYIKPTKVTSENVESLIEILSTIRPLNMTNIELALETVSAYVEETIEDIKRNNHVIILLTDGDSNVGQNSPNILAELIPNGISSNFIALGQDHNVDLMYALGHKNEQTSNWFINQLENTGSVYGEILYNETHRVLYDTKIKVTNGQIFDYVKGEFVDDIMLGTLSSEMKKQYHILSNTPDDCSVVITGVTMNGKMVEVYLCDIPPLICDDDVFDYDIHNITKQYLRLGVQKLMADVRVYIQKSKNNTPQPRNNLFNLINKRIEMEYNSDYTKFNKHAKVMFQYVNDFIEKNNLQEDTLLKGLNDDLLLLLKTTNKVSIKNIQLINAREDSQGRQTSYTVDANVEDEDDSNIILSKNLQRNITSAYSTPGREDMMRVISGVDVADDFEINDNNIQLTPVKLQRSICIPYIADDESNIQIRPVKLQRGICNTYIAEDDDDPFLSNDIFKKLDDYNECSQSKN